MYFAAFDAVRVAEREILSARPDAPVIEHLERPARAYTIRRVASVQLHRIAHAIAPGGVHFEPELAARRPTSC